MKKKSPPWAFIAAIALFLVAGYSLYMYKKSADEDKAKAIAAEQAKYQDALDRANASKVQVTPTPTNVRPVLYATQPVEPGIPLSPAFYETKLTPNDILPDAFTDKDNIANWVAIRPIEKGDPLTPRNIGKGLAHMSERLTPGMRLLALPIFNADANNTSGFIVDGDKVDLLYTTLGTTQLIMQNLSVLYVPGPSKDTRSEKTQGVDPAAPPGDTISVSFEVTPEQAQALVNLSQGVAGKFSMILRSRKDDSEIKIKPFNQADYVGNLSRLQKVVDRSSERVNELSKEIDEREKNQNAQGATNEITTPSQ